MAYKDISIGNNPPEEVNAIIENPVGGPPVKYEMDKATGRMLVDRFRHTAMVYPGNYGFIPHTLSEDGDPVDIIIIGDIPVMPGAVMPAVPIGVLLMEDESGMDEKIVAVPPDRLLPAYEGIKDYTELPETLCKKIEHFFKHYKDLEEGKWSRLDGWRGAADARKIIEEGIEREKKTVKLAVRPDNSGPKTQ